MPRTYVAAEATRPHFRQQPQQPTMSICLAIAVTVPRAICIGQLITHRQIPLTTLSLLGTGDSSPLAYQMSRREGKYVVPAIFRWETSTSPWRRRRIPGPKAPLRALCAWGDAIVMLPIRIAIYCAWLLGGYGFYPLEPTPPKCTELRMSAAAPERRHNGMKLPNRRYLFRFVSRPDRWSHPLHLHWRRPCIVPLGPSGSLCLARSPRSSAGGTKPRSKLPATLCCRRK